MFTNERSEIAIPIVGFMLVGFSAILVAINLIQEGWIQHYYIETVGACCTALGIVLAIASGYVFSKLLMLEGVMFGIFSIVMFGTSAGMFSIIGLLGVALAIISLMLAFMAYRAGDLPVFVIGLASLIAFIPLLVFQKDAAILISAFGFCIVGAVALITALQEWIIIQDIEFDMEDEMYGECGCGCSCEDETCDCDEHSDKKCDCGCEDHKE